MKNLCILRTLLAGLFLVVHLMGCRDTEPVAVRTYPRIDRTDIVTNTESGVRLSTRLFNTGNTTLVDCGYYWIEAYRNVDEPVNLVKWERISLGRPRNSTDFEATLEYGLRRTGYVVRPYVSSQDGVTVYGPGILVPALGSKAPVLTAITPNRAADGDTIQIAGQYFAHLSATLKVEMGIRSWFGFDQTYTAKIIASTPTQIRFIVPTTSKIGSFLFFRIKTPGGETMLTSGFALK